MMQLSRGYGEDVVTTPYPHTDSVAFPSSITRLLPSKIPPVSLQTTEDLIQFLFFQQTRKPRSPPRGLSPAL